MEIASKQLNSKKNTTIIYMKSSLLSIDEFTARCGISKNIIEECAKIGLIKTRKYKGKTFVLDTPASRYQGGLENSNEQLNHQAMHAQRIAELADKIPTNFPEENTIAIEISKETIRKPDQITKKQITSPQIVKPTAKPAGKTKQADSLAKTNTFLLGISTKQTKAKTKWKVAALSMLVLLCTAILINIWLYTDRNIKTNTIEKYHLSYQKMYEEAGRVHQNAELVQDELNAYKAELKSTRDSLKRTSQYLNIIEERNMKNNDKLSKQILKIVDELSDSTITP